MIPKEAKKWTYELSPMTANAITKKYNSKEEIKRGFLNGEIKVGAIKGLGKKGISELRSWLRLPEELPKRCKKDYLIKEVINAIMTLEQLAKNLMMR